MFTALLLFELLTSSAAAGTSAHHAHTLNRPAEPPRPIMALPSEGRHHSTVYGYVYGGPAATERVDFDSVTHVSWHRFEMDSAGNISDESGWTSYAPGFVSAAHAAGVKVHLTLMPISIADMQSTLLSPTHRANAVSQMASFVNSYGADGVNIDFESLDSTTKTELVSFTQEMSAAVDEVYLSTPTKDWGNGYDYDALAYASDGLVIMGYDHHVAGSDPGPVSMLDSGDLWDFWSLVWALEDYRTWGTPDSHIVMALPLYGRKWNAASAEVPGVQTSACEESCVPTWNGCTETIFPTYGRSYEPFSATSWTWTGEQQIWCDDLGSMEEKLLWALSEGIQGIGFWEVGYAAGDTELWTLVDDLTMTPEEEPDSGTPDTGATDTGATDTDFPDTGMPIDTGSVAEASTEEEKVASGCSCSAAPFTLRNMGSSLVVALFAGLVARRRRADH